MLQNMNNRVTQIYNSIYLGRYLKYNFFKRAFPTQCMRRVKQDTIFIFKIIFSFGVIYISNPNDDFYMRVIFIAVVTISYYLRPDHHHTIHFSVFLRNIDFKYVLQSQYRNAKSKDICRQPV